jgi:hypothetical protein
MKRATYLLKALNIFVNQGNFIAFDGIAQMSIKNKSTYFQKSKRG